MHESGQGGKGWKKDRGEKNNTMKQTSKDGREAASKLAMRAIMEEKGEKN